MTELNEGFWSRTIRRQIHELVMLLVILGLIAAGSVTWIRGSNDTILSQANDYHFSGYSAYLKAIEELRYAQVYLAGLKLTGIVSSEQVNLEGLRDDYNLVASIYIIRQQIRNGLELERRYADTRFDSLSDRLKRQLDQFGKISSGYIQDDAVPDQMVQQMEGILVTLRQLLRLHSVTRDELLTGLELRKNRQAIIIYSLLGALFVAGALITKRTLGAIGAVITEYKRAEENLLASERKFRAITNQSTEGITVADQEGNYVFVNAAFSEMIGYSEEELLHMTVFDVKAPEQDASSFEQSKTSHAETSIQVYLQRKDGTRFLSEVTGKMIEFNGKQQVLGTIRDITDRVQAENALRESEERFDLAMSVANDGIWDWRLDDNTVVFDARYYTIAGYKPGEFSGAFEEWQKRVHRDDVEQATSAFEKYLAGDNESYDVEFRFLRKDGGYMWIRARGEVVERDHAGNPVRFVGTHSDITERKMVEEKVLHQAHFDDLTDLPNRFLSLDRLSQLFSEARRANDKVAVLFLDLDDFKKVNDTLGHEVGDKVLIEAAERLRSVVRGSDTVGRLGGDEFIVMLGGLEGAVDARSITEHLLNRFRDAFSIDGRELILTTSVGIAVFPDDGDDTSEILRNADSAMYHAKASGRNTYSYFTEAMNRDVSRRLALEEQIHGALDRGEFTVLYQPQINVASGRIIGAEALLRWHNPVLGDVPPDEFIPITEHTGLIIAIGKFVLTEALGMTTQWRKNHGPDFRIAVNLSPRQFRDPELVSWIDRSAQQHHLPASCLELEITEGVLMSGHSYIDDALDELNKLGVKIAMDDFGTGYSSLSYLRRYPFDVLKIERSFIGDLTVDKADRELINAAIAMAHGLNLEVVAEGVETQEQFEYLKNQGCDYVQGYYFSEPVSAEKLTGMLGSGDTVTQGRTCTTG